MTEFIFGKTPRLWYKLLLCVHTKTRNELEPPGTTWNELERVRTSWNELEPSRTRWNDLFEIDIFRSTEGIRRRVWNIRRVKDKWKQLSTVTLFQTSSNIKLTKYNVNMYKNYALRNSVSTVKKSQCISLDSTLVP